MHPISNVKKICFVGPGHLSSTPRLVKEADAAAGAGYAVSVVCARHFAPVDPLDEAVIARSPWRCVRVDARSGAGTLVSKAARKAARLLAPRLASPPLALAALAEDAVSLRIARAAAAERADLYVGHCIGGLYAAAAAARSAGTRFAFDIEDYHDGETAGVLSSEAALRSIRALQSRLLPRAGYLTSASPLIGERVQELYGCPSKVVLNVFPRTEAPDRPFLPEPASAAKPAVLYWFSQTVGPDRGLEQVLAITARMRTPAVLHLRGHCSDAYRASLTERAASLGIAHPPVFLGLADASEMVRLSAHAHAGLCTETAAVPNRDLCLTNKIFTYLLAGVPALLSRTRAHERLLPELGSAGRIMDLGDIEGSARTVDALLGEAGPLRAARDEAWRLGHERYCWDIESGLFLGCVRSALA